jgi:hypothetical protein
MSLSAYMAAGCGWWLIADAILRMSGKGGVFEHGLSGQKSTTPRAEVTIKLALISAIMVLTWPFGVIYVAVVAARGAK